MPFLGHTHNSTTTDLIVRMKHSDPSSYPPSTKKQTQVLPTLRLHSWLDSLVSHNKHLINTFDSLSKKEEEIPLMKLITHPQCSGLISYTPRIVTVSQIVQKSYMRMFL